MCPREGSEDQFYFFFEIILILFLEDFFFFEVSTDICNLLSLPYQHCDYMGIQPCLDF